MERDPEDALSPTEQAIIDQTENNHLGLISFHLISFHLIEFHVISRLAKNVSQLFPAKQLTRSAVARPNDEGTTGTLLPRCGDESIEQPVLDA